MKGNSGIMIVYIADVQRLYNLERTAASAKYHKIHKHFELEVHQDLTRYHLALYMAVPLDVLNNQLDN